MAKKRSGLDTIMPPPVATETGAKPRTRGVTTRRAALPAPVAKPEKQYVRTDFKRHSLYLPREVDQQLRDLVHEENRGQWQTRKIHDYFLEAIDLLFKDRGLKSSAELTGE